MEVGSVDNFGTIGFNGKDHVAKFIGTGPVGGAVHGTQSYR